jgi:catechol 2,3-dioxygenase-like lactoylglutathione lyase family enzyme
MTSLMTWLVPAVGLERDDLVATMDKEAQLGMMLRALGVGWNRVKGGAMANVKFTGIHHVKLPVSDLARSREWYERVLAYTVEREFPDDDGVVRGVGGRLPGAGVPVALRQNAQAAAGNAGFDPVSFAIADRAAAEAWTAHFDALGVRHSGIRGATRGWVVDVYDPDGLTIRLYSTGDDAEDHTNQPGYAHTV